MSLITFRDKNTSGDPVGPVWYLNFDALTVEELTRSAEVTQYPVETGATLSDHYQPLPREISLTGVVSDTPSGPWSNLEKMQNAAAPPRMAVRNLKLQTRPENAPRGPQGVIRPITTSFLPGRRVVQSNIERARLYIPRFAVTLQTTRDADLSPATKKKPGGTDYGQESRVTSFTTVLDGLMETRTVVSVLMQTGNEYENMMITSFRAPRIAGRSGSVTFLIDMQEIVLADPVKVVKAEERSEPKIKQKKATGRKSTKKTTPGTDPQLQALIDGGNLQLSTPPTSAF